jgi:hypothetical protein
MQFLGGAAVGAKNEGLFPGPQTAVDDQNFSIQPFG